MNASKVNKEGDQKRKKKMIESSAVKILEFLSKIIHTTTKNMYPKKKEE